MPCCVSHCSPEIWGNDAYLPGLLGSLIEVSIPEIKEPFILLVLNKHELLSF